MELAASVGRLDMPKSITLGPSQAYQIRKALALYHYINPKLLLITAALRGALEGGVPASSVPSGQRSVERIPRGEPPGMYPMEMVSPDPDDPAIARLFAEITRHYSLSTINSDYRTLALWPDYLAGAWPRLKSLSVSPTYKQADRGLKGLARELVSGLPGPVSLSAAELNQQVKQAAGVKKMVASFNQRLPPLLLNIALLALDWQTQDQLAQSPYPIGGS